jgi:hypothetical protein
MALVTDESNLFNFIHGSFYTGQYSGSWGSQDLANNMGNTNVAYTPTVYPLAYNTNSPLTLLTHGFNTYFKMQGFNNSTNTYEVWYSTTTPLLIPPSGHTLSSIEVVLTWIDR